MNKFILDTNICIYLINNKPIEVYNKFKKIKIENVSISSITDFELHYGVQKSSKYEQNLTALKEFIGFLNVIPFDSEDATIAAKIRLDLEKQGKPIGAYDLLIASQALVRNLILVTNNEKEFVRVKQLKIENWIK